MATVSAMVLILPIQNVLLKVLQRTEKEVYSPYGPRMCNELKINFKGPFIFEENILSCRIIHPSRVKEVSHNNSISTTVVRDENSRKSTPKGDQFIVEQNMATQFKGRVDQDFVKQNVHKKDSELITQSINIDQREMTTASILTRDREMVTQFIYKIHRVLAKLSVHTHDRERTTYSRQMGHRQLNTVSRNAEDQQLTRELLITQDRFLTTNSLYSDHRDTTTPYVLSEDRDLTTNSFHIDHQDFTTPYVHSEDHELTTASLHSDHQDFTTPYVHSEDHELTTASLHSDHQDFTTSYVHSEDHELTTNSLHSEQRVFELEYLHTENPKLTTQSIHTKDMELTTQTIHENDFESQYIPDVRLHQASKEGKLGAVKYILAHGLEDINSRDRWGRTPVMLAAKMAQLPVFVYLVGQGCDLSSRSVDGNSVLHLACLGGQIDIIRRVIGQEKCDMEEAGWCRWTPVMYAVHSGKITTVKFLVGKGCNLRITDKNDNNILHLACVDGCLEMVKYILSLHVVSRESRGFAGRTPLMKAAEKGNRKVLYLLLLRRCNLRAVDRQGNTILHVASIGGHTDMVKYLLTLRAVVRMKWTKNGRGETPLQTAERFGHRGIVRLLKQ